MESFDFEDMIYTELVQIPDISCPNQHCRTRLIDGYLQCPRCYQEIGANTDARVATEVARREAMARVRGVPFSMEAVEFHATRRSKQSGRATSAGVVRTRSAYGALRELAKNYRRQVLKKGYKDVVDRLERDCFFQFNCASQNLTPDALVFLTRIAGCLSPPIERTKDQVHGEALMAGTKLVFIPEVGRDPTAPLSLQKETFIVHRGVFLTPGQFAVLVVKFIKARGTRCLLLPVGEEVSFCQKRKWKVNWLERLSRLPKHSGSTMPRRSLMRQESLVTVRCQNFQGHQAELQLQD